VSPLDPDVPPAGEDIHLPGPSIQPLLLAFGITVALVGVTTFFPLVVAGAILSVVVIVRWIRDTRRDVDELPLGPH
jgi:Flp pilus assembly protein TadB